MFIGNESVPPSSTLQIYLLIWFAVRDHVRTSLKILILLRLVKRQGNQFCHNFVGKRYLFNICLDNMLITSSLFNQVYRFNIKI